MSNQTLVRCYFKTFGDFVTVYSTSAGHGGFFITANQRVAQGEAVRLEFKLRNDYPLITGEGMVVSVQPGGFSVEFSKLDDESEKFLNEVVKVKAAEVKVDPAAPLPVYEAQVEGGAGGGDDLDAAFADISEEVIEEVAELAEPAEADPFADLSLEEPAAPAAEASGDMDFSDLNLSGDEPSGLPAELPAEDGFDLPAGTPDAGEVADPFGAAAATDAPEQSGEYEDSEYEQVEQTPANPQALFEDIPADGDAGSPQAGEATVGGSTTVFERLSTLKERKALLIGAGVGLVAVCLAAGGWFFFLRAPSGEMQTAALTAAAAPAPAPEASPAAPQAATQATAAPATQTAAAPATGSTNAAAEAEPAPPVPAQAVPAPVTPPPAPVAAVVPPPPPPAPKAAPVALKAPPPAAKAAPAKALGRASKVTQIQALADGSIVITGNGAFDKIKHFGADGPNRIVVDVYGVAKGFPGLSKAGAGAVSKVRMGEHDGKVRFVFDLKRETGKIPAYSVDKDGDRITFRVP